MSHPIKKSLIILQALGLLLLGAWSCGEGVDLGLDLNDGCGSGEQAVLVGGVPTCVNQTPGENPTPSVSGGGGSGGSTEGEGAVEEPVVPTAEPECQNDSDCAAGQVCNAEQLCEAAPPPAEPVVCDNAADCPVPFVCDIAEGDTEGVCKIQVFHVNFASCENTSDCVDALYCKEGSCMPKTCINDVHIECPKAGDSCIDGFCRMP